MRLAALEVDAQRTMDISGPGPALAAAIQVAVQMQMLDGLKAQGAGVVSMIASAPTPAGSVNGPAQGQHVDAFA